MGKHTPGPWRVSIHPRWVMSESGGPIACVEQDRKFADANAALIAAAPELLETIEGLLPFVEGYAENAERDDPVHEMLPRWRSIVAKAKGKAP